MEGLRAVRNHSGPIASSGARSQKRVLHSTGKLMRSLKTIAAQYGDQHEVVAVCQKWACRISELQRQASDAGVRA